MTNASPCLYLKRIYESPSPDDGVRILVDRLWPRGVRKADAEIDLWLRDVAPSTELREWFQHNPVRFQAFGVLYRDELTHQPVKSRAVRELIDYVRQGRTTLLYAAKDEAINHAIVLRDFVLDHLRAD